MVLYLQSTVMMNLISKERNLVLKMFMGSMTSYPLERYISFPQGLLASTIPLANKSVNETVLTRKEEGRKCFI